MKEGESVFVGPGIIHWMPVDTHHPTVRFKDYATTCHVSELIPDVPNLAHIARYLAEHPETVDALGKAANHVRPNVEKAKTVGYMAYSKELQGVVDLIVGLTAAMRGEGGHE